MKNKKLNNVLLAAISASLLIGTASSSWAAASVGANFVGRDPGFPLPRTAMAGAVPQANWNNVSSDPFSGTTLPMIDNNGNFTSVTLNYQCSDSWHANQTITSTSTPDEILMQGIIKANPDPDLTPGNNSDRMLFTFSGLGSGNYDVLVYGMENDSLDGAYMNVNVGTTTYYFAENQGFAGTFILATSTDPANYEFGPNYARFNGVAPVSGVITVTCRKRIDNPQVTDGIGVAALQLIAAGTIPPNTVGISITNEPVSSTIGEGETATFTVGFSGPGNVQWQRNGTDIAGATSATYTIVGAVSDSGAKFKAVVTNNLGSSTSFEATLTVVAAQLTQGFASLNRWENIGGNTGQQGLDDLVAAIGASPATFSSFLPSLDAPQTAPDISNFGCRLTGWIKPTVTGDYDFFIRSDDSSEMFLNQVALASGPNALPNPATDVPICSELACCNPFAEPSAGTTRTTVSPIHLDAGKLYGFAVLYKEGGGGDFAQVAWRNTTDTTPAVSLTPIPGAVLWTMVSPAGKTAGISVQPKPATTFEGLTATFSLSVTGSPAGAYSVQWTKNGTAVPGVSGATYTTPVTTLVDNGAKIKAMVLTLVGLLTSDEVTLTVLPDTNAPVALGAGALKNSAGTFDIGIQFDERLDAATATNTANYTIAGVTASGIYYLSNSPGVVLRVGALTPGNQYTVNIKNVKDALGNAITSQDVSFTVSALGWDVVGGEELLLGFPSGNAVVATGPGNYDVYSDGFTEWAAYDETTFVYEQITGDFDKRVRVEYQDLSSQWARAGLIVRDVPNFGVARAAQEGGAAGRYQKIHVNPSGPTRTGPGTAGNNSHESNRRLDKGSATTAAALTANTTPAYPNAWVRLQRIGQTNNLFRSDDGIAWVYMGRTVFGVDNTDGEMPATVYVGPEYSPENGNVTTVDERGRWLAKFRSYSDTFAPPDAPATRTYSIGMNFGANRESGGIASTLQATDVAGVPGVAQKYWNNISDAAGSTNTLYADQNGTAQTTTATVTWNAPNLWTSQGDGEFNDVLSGADHILMHGLLDTGDSTTTTVKVGNITTNLTDKGYDVYVYFAGGVAGRGGGYRIVDGVSGAVLKDYVYARCQALPTRYQRVQDNTSITNFGAGNYIVFRGLTAASIQVEASTANGIGMAGLVRGVGTPRAPLNAVQLVAPSSAPPVTGPVLSISTVGTTTTITFTGKLQSSTTVNAGYADVPGATSPYTVTPSGSGMFFRAVQ